MNMFDWFLHTDFYQTLTFCTARCQVQSSGGQLLVDLPGPFLKIFGLISDLMIERGIIFGLSELHACLFITVNNNGNEQTSLDSTSSLFFTWFLLFIFQAMKDCGKIRLQWLKGINSYIYYLWSNIIYKNNFLRISNSTFITVYMFRSSQHTAFSFMVTGLWWPIIVFW